VGGAYDVPPDSPCSAGEGDTYPLPAPHTMIPITPPPTPSACRASRSRQHKFLATPRAMLYYTVSQFHNVIMQCSNKMTTKKWLYAKITYVNFVIFIVKQSLADFNNFWRATSQRNVSKIKYVPYSVRSLGIEILLLYTNVTNVSLSVVCCSLGDWICTERTPHHFSDVLS